MFIPFFPFIIAMAGLTAVAGSGAGQATLGAGELALSYAALLVLGLLVGHISETWLGGRSPMQFGRRRAVLLMLWVLSTAWVPMLSSLQVLWGGGTAAEAAALAALLANFWLADGLAMHAVNPLQPGRVSADLRGVAGKLRVSLPIVFLVTVGILASPLFQRIAPGEGGLGLVPGWVQTLGGLAFYLALVAVLIPVLIRVCWGLGPLRSREAERVIREELAANRVRMARVVGWPEEMTGYATAGVIGLVPGFRYLLFADTLAEGLSPDEIRSVTAHEAAHVRQHHLWYYLVAIAAFILFAQVVLQAMLWSGLLMGFSPPFWLIVSLELLGLVLFLRFGVGFLSRHFERQADGNALRRHGLVPFQNALAKLGMINRIPVEHNNWHHYGIAHRVAYLRDASAQPERLKRHDRGVFRIKLACLVALGACLTAQSVFSSTTVITYLAERYWLSRLETAAEPAPAALSGLSFLAAQAHQQGELETAERYYRLVLRHQPGNAQVQNNLAWLLVTRPEPSAAALNEGLRLARKAARTADSAYIWDTLAEAHARLGHRQQAATAAQRALERARAGQGPGDASLEYYRSRVAELKP